MEDVACRGHMEALAARMPPPELNRLGYQLYEAFRPDMPESASSFGAKGKLRLDRVGEAASSVT